MHHYHADSCCAACRPTNRTPVQVQLDGRSGLDYQLQGAAPRSPGNADRYNHRDGNDDYRQAGDLFRLMSADQKEQLFHNIKAAMDGVPMEIVKRQVAHFYRADPDYGIGVATRMGLSASDLPAAQAARVVGKQSSFNRQGIVDHGRCNACSGCQYANVVDELFTEAKIDALNAKLIERGISADQVIAILPVEAQIVASPTPPQFRVLYRTV